MRFGLRVGRLWIRLHIRNSLDAKRIISAKLWDRADRGVFALAPHQKGSVHDDAGEPGCKSRAPLKFAIVTTRGKKRVLHGILGVFVIPENPMGNSDKPFA